MEDNLGKEKEINDIFNALQKNGRLIGSRKWGGETEESDYDIVIDMDKYIKLNKYCDEKNIWRNFNNGSGENNLLYNKENMKIILDKLKINVIGYDNADIDNANKAFDIVDKVNKIIPLTKKETRHRICENALDLFFEREDFGW